MKIRDLLGNQPLSKHFNRPVYPRTTDIAGNHPIWPLSASCAGWGVEGEAKAISQLDLPRRPQAQNERRDVRRLHDRAAHGQFQRLSIRNAIDIEHLDAIVRWGGDQ